MKHPKNWVSAGLTLLLAACIAGYFLTDPDQPKSAPKSNAGGQVSLIDQRLIQTARQAASLADTADEQDLAREALRLADHELDQAFSTAMREAAGAAANLPPALQQVSARISAIQTKIAAEQKRIAQLTNPAASNEEVDAQLQLVKAQMALDQDELEDAQQDLARQGGDEHEKLERALQEHENAQHLQAVPPAPAPPGTSTLNEQVRYWIALGSRGNQIAAAHQQAAARSASLLREHNGLEALKNKKPAPAVDAAATGDDTEDTSAMIARLQRLSNQAKTLTELDHRIQDTQQLGDVYQRWGAAVETRRRGVLHVMLQSLGIIFGVLLTLVLGNHTMRRAFRNMDRRSLHHTRFISTLVLQAAGLIAILLIVFGPPTQVSTFIGLATAGLTVVLKDFIVAFFGWFVVMGRNGVRVGDWVEINGIGGEVIEIGLFKTVLLEMGNWTSTGHPTGRRVSFMNGFAIEGHFFNFSTTGQWLWDELKVSVPAGGDPYGIAGEIRAEVERATEADARQAEQDWERVTSQYGTRAFSASPAVDLQPGPAGLEVIVRYITRAPLRYEVKSKLFQAIVALLHKSAGAATR
jgi:small-conductance mechanosensitive channel